jgi:hypothetical protein
MTAIRHTHAHHRPAVVPTRAAPPAPGAAQGGVLAMPNTQQGSGPLGYYEQPIPADARWLPPVQQGDQGISPSERPDAERAIAALFARAGGVNWIATYAQDTGLYEIRSRTGSLKWSRWATPDGRIMYRVESITGQNPVTNTDPRAMRTLAEEQAAAGGYGKPVPANRTSYPDMLQRISQLFDSRRAPDFVYIPTGGGDPNHPGAGSHGVPDITQSRAPLIMAGPGIQAGTVSDTLVRSEDVAPTIAQLIGIAPVVGTNATGVPRLQYLKWQDGHSLVPAIAASNPAGAGENGVAQRAMVFVLDGASKTVLEDEIAKGRLPNIARLMHMGVRFENGSLVEYPTVTYANHNTLTTGASPGHEGILNNSWYNRDTGDERLITDGPFTNSLRVGRLMDPQVETLYEAVRRTFGADATTLAMNEPSGRGSTVATLDLNGIGKLATHLFGIALNYLRDKKDLDPRYASDPDFAKSAKNDRWGEAIGQSFYSGSNPPKLSVFELGMTDTLGHKMGPQSAESRASMEQADKAIGRLLEVLDTKGLTDSTMFVVTADHGMEHQYTNPKQLGGWFDALRTSGVKVVESTRFVYVKNVRYDVHGPIPRAGVTSPMAVRVINDDVNDKGFRPAVTGAAVTVSDRAGHIWTGYTDATGVAHLEVTPTDGSPLSIEIDHPAFTSEHGEISVAGGAPAVTPHVAAKRRH